jgi:F-type H+-transporting ATPase subunit epsilon
VADTFQLEVATAERLFVDEQVTGAEIPGKDGYMGILPGHAPLLSALGAGALSYTSGGGEQVLAIDGGFVEVFDNHVRVLADYAEFGRDIPADPARQELERALEAMRAPKNDAAESEAALHAVNKAQARVDAAEKVSGRTRVA